jgi:DNA-damage-inducible protein J
MGQNTTMLHVRIDEQLKEAVTGILKDSGLSLSDAVRILMNTIDKRGGFPVELLIDDAAIREKVFKAMADKRPLVPNEIAMLQIDKIIREKRQKKDNPQHA